MVVETKVETSHETSKKERQSVMVIDVSHQRKKKFVCSACPFTARAVVLDHSSGEPAPRGRCPFFPTPVTRGSLPLHRSSGGPGPLERWQPCQSTSSLTLH